MNKTMAIDRICDFLDYENTDILYFGDAFHENGDDYCVKDLGIDCVEVSSPEETKKAIRTLLEKGKLCNI